MKTLYKDLWLPLLLIMLACGILLVSDRHQRNSLPRNYGENDSLQAQLEYTTTVVGKKDKAPEDLITIDFSEVKKAGTSPSIAMLEKADVFINLAVWKKRPGKVALITLIDNPLCEEAEEGVITALHESGLVPQVDYVFKKYSAQGEIGQLPQIMEAAASEKPDVIITVTTPAMMAAVKKITDIPVVFTVTSSPMELNAFPSGRPANVCGVHDNPRLDILLDLLVKHEKDVKTIGIVYDPSQMNAVLSVEKLRVQSKKRKIRLFEATASSVSELGMATQSLIQRGAQAIVVSADNLVNSGFPSISKVAKAARIPIYTTEPSLVALGAKVAYGDSFLEWGKQSGRMAAKILAGVPPSHLPLTETEVQLLIEPKVNTIRQKSGPFKLRLVLYSETEFAERCRDGLLDGFKKAGFVQGVDYTLKEYNAQGDMSILSGIMTSVKSDQVDLLLVISTPTLQAALRQAGNHTKIVFTGVGDGVKAGAGTSETDHLPNVTGITTRSPFTGMARLIKESIPNVKKVGTLFTPAEINSQLYKEWFQEALEEEGIELVALPLTSSADIAQTAAQLSSKDIQLACQIVDNLTRPGFALIARKAADKNIPVFVFDSDQMKEGGTLCLARDYYDAGLEAAELAVRVLKGEDPATLPFRNTQSEKLLINLELAQKYHLKNLDALLKKGKLYSATP